MERTNGSVSLPLELRLFGGGSVILFLVFWIAKIISGLLHLPGNATWLIFPRVFRFIDYNCFRFRFLAFHHAAFFDPNAGLTFMYPAPAALIYEPFYLVPMQHSIVIYSLVTGALLLLCAMLFAQAMVRHGVAQKTAYLFCGVALVFSYPLMVNFYLGNIEVVVGLIIGLGLERWLHGRSYTAAILLGVAASMKIFPFIFLALLLSRRQYRQILVSLLVAAVSTVAGLWLISGSIPGAWHGIQGGLENFRMNYALALSPVDVAIDHSLFGLIKGTLIAVGAHPAPLAFSRVLSLYMALVALVGLLLYFLRIRLLPMANQVMLISILGIMLPPASHDYTLMHLYVAWAMLVLLSLRYARDGQHLPGIVPAFVCLTLIMVPLGEFMIHYNPIGGQLKCLLLLALCWIGLRYPFEMEEGRESAEGDVGDGVVFAG